MKWDFASFITMNFLVYCFRFTASEYPVLAFKGSPGNFPSLPEHHSIQKYLKFSKRIEKIADDFLSNEMKGKRYLAIHLRNGRDMV